MLEDIQGFYFNPRNIISFLRTKKNVSVITVQTEMSYSFDFGTEDDAKDAESLLINLILQTLN